MSPSDALNLPEIIHTIIEIAKYHNFGKGGYIYDEALFHSFLLRISLVSRTWSQETRPFLFQTVKLSFGTQYTPVRRYNGVVTTLQQAAIRIFQHIRGTSLPPVLQRMEELLELIQSNPRISGYVKRLELDYAPGLAPASEFSQCAATLVHLYDGFHTLNSLHISWNAWSDSLRRGESPGWWTGKLDEVGRQTFQHLIESRPSLRTLYTLGAALPLSMWSSTITQAFICYAPPNTITLNDGKARMSLPTQRTKNALSSLVDLTIVDDSSRISDIWSTISYSRKTLRRLVCGIDLTSATPPPVGSSSTMGSHHSPPGTRDKFFVLADFPELRFCSLTLTLNRFPPSEVSDWAIQAVESFPWRIVVTFSFKMILRRCPTPQAGLAHTPFDPISMFKKLDILISRHVGNRLRANAPMFSTRFGLEIQNPCAACNESGLIPSPSSPIWNVATIFPRLSQYNQKGLLGLWVKFKYWDSENQEKAYFPEYISEPYRLKSRQ